MKYAYNKEPNMNAELPSDVTPKIQPSELTSEAHTHTHTMSRYR